MDRILEFALRLVVRRGTLRITTANGRSFILGDGTGSPVAARFTSAAAERGILIDPELKLGEAYMDGGLVVEEGSVADLLFLLLGQGRPESALRWLLPHWVARFLGRHLQQFNPRSRARRNVSHHYDLDGHFYTLFLDSDRQYSCAYFETADQGLDDAQLAKKRHIAAKLRIERAQSILDIGSGWGGLALYLAEVSGARVTGITLSQEQLAYARGRASEKNFGSVEFRLQDYRDVRQTFDRIVSVGMFEHVGVDFYRPFFRRCAEMLADDGIMLLHAIGRSEGPGITNPWIAKYIFPGGYIPALSEVVPAIERAGLLITDIEILRMHYAYTLKAWRERFLAHREEAERLYDARFVRMWEFYLAASEMAFRQQSMMVFQIQLTKRQGVVPITRDYMTDADARLRELENARRLPLRMAGE